ncbi:uncharacterized protein EAF02_011030 [Botrytis sinoallii]|uniref:uncharacterized protein n=1 Tax=Botrytis sinoallii TaxID=1463999 RepID=UPI0019011599|nr:uncharacterized protein EAF02_011030 [Botrytis sinoallii]KAF7858706.1 hypothetical protein EAF02_011030 [Botrytis sinoallii]
MNSLLIALVTAPALLANEAIRQGQTKDRKEEHRARRCNLITSCVEASPLSLEVDHRQIILRDSKSMNDPTLHLFAGYYLPRPDPTTKALETYEVEYGVRLDAQPNITGPFDCTRQDRRLTLEGWEGFCAVKKEANGEKTGIWALYYDRDDDRLVKKLEKNRKVVEIELSRQEKRVRRGKPLGEMR